MTNLITNIKELINVRSKSHLLHGKEMADLPSIQDAYLLIENDEIADFGKMDDLRSSPGKATNFDASGKFVLPAWCDSHTHLVFAGSREGEFIDKLKGLTYSQIAAKGGGILASAQKLKETSEDDLFNQAWARLKEVTSTGTGAIEIKSGYGLTVESEMKMLRVIKKLKEKSTLSIKSTFLGAHTYPVEYKDHHQGYIDLIINEMLPVIAGEKLADYIDVFCETGFFSAEETEQICKAGLEYGMKPKIHTNQLTSSGGIAMGIKLNAISLDHLETLLPDDVSLLSKSSASGWNGTCTLLPTSAFFLRMPYQPARELIETGCAVALASDFNPGSSPSGNMNFVVALGCIKMKMLPEEAINAVTLNGAYAMETGNELGSITIGKKANLILTKQIPSLAFLPYSFGSNLVERVMIRGDWQ